MLVAYAQRGLVRLERGLHYLAIVDFDKVIELNPEDATGYRQRAKAFEVSGQPDKAAHDLSRAAELQPTGD